MRAIDIMRSEINRFQFHHTMTQEARRHLASIAKRAVKQKRSAQSAVARELEKIVKNS